MTIMGIRTPLIAALVCALALGGSKQACAAPAASPNEPVGG
jgi:hypothetical protein